MDCPSLASSLPPLLAALACQINLKASSHDTYWIYIERPLSPGQRRLSLSGSCVCRKKCSSLCGKVVSTTGVGRERRGVRRTNDERLGINIQGTSTFERCNTSSRPATLHHANNISIYKIYTFKTFVPIICIIWPSCVILLLCHTGYNVPSRNL